MPSTDLARRPPLTPARRLASAPARGLKALAAMVFGGTHGLVWRFMPRTRFDFAREVGDGMSSSVLMAPILWMARTFPEAPLQVLDADEEVITGHPLIRKLRRPNDFYSGIALWMATLLSWWLSGDAYWIKVKNQAGTSISELWYAPHWLIEPKGNSETFITHYVYTAGGQQIDLDPSEIVHFRNGLDPRNPRKGLSPLGSLFREIFTDEEAANFSASLLRNVGVPGLIVSPDVGASSGPSQDDVQATKDYVDEEYRGDRRGRPLVMSGPTKVQQFGFSPQQMDLTNLRRIPEERVTAILGLSAMVVGLGAGLERSTFTNYAEARTAAYESNIIPTQRLMAEELRHQLLIPDYQDGVDDDSEVVFDLRKVRVLQDDRDAEGKRLTGLYTGGVITRAEARKPLGHEITAADNVYSVPITSTIVPAGEAGTDPRLTDSDDSKRRRGRKDVDKTRDRVALIEALTRVGTNLRNVFATELETALDTLGMAAARAFDTSIKTAAWTGGTKDAGTSNEDVAADAAIVDQILDQVNVDEWKRSELEPLFETHYTRVAASTVDTINTVLELGVMLEDPVEKGIVQAGGTRLGLVDIDEQTKTALYQALADAREAGEGPIAAAKRIRQYVPAGRFTTAGAKYRAEAISRTETKHAQNISSLAAYNGSGTVTQVQAFDGEDDAPCADRDGVVFSLEAADDEDLAHTNCTLSWAPIVG